MLCLEPLAIICYLNVDDLASECGPINYTWAGIVVVRGHLIA